MTNEAQDKVLLIAVLEIIFLTFIAIFSIGFISVPNLFIQGAIDRANHSRFEKELPTEGHDSIFTPTSAEDDEPDYEGIENAVTRLLIFVDFFLIFHLIVHTLIVIGFNKAAKTREHKKFLPWFIFNCILLPVVLAGAIYAFVRFCCVPVAAFNHVLNVIFIVYKCWAMLTVFMYMKELRDRVTLNDRYGPEKSGDDDGNY